MKNGKHHQHGTIEKIYQLKLTYENSKKTIASSVNALVEKEASLGIDFNMGSIGCGPDFWEKVLGFQKESNKIIKLARKLMKQGINVKLNYIVSAYEGTEEREEYTIFGKEKTSINQVSFSAWEFDGAESFEDSSSMVENAEDQEGGGIYLLPDERYTSADKAIWISWQNDFTENLMENSFCDYK